MCLVGWASAVPKPEIARLFGKVSYVKMMQYLLQDDPKDASFFFHHLIACFMIIK